MDITNAKSLNEYETKVEELKSFLTFDQKQEEALKAFSVISPFAKLEDTYTIDGQEKKVGEAYKKINEYLNGK